MGPQQNLERWPAPRGNPVGAWLGWLQLWRRVTAAILVVGLIVCTCPAVCRASSYAQTYQDDQVHAELVKAVILVACTAGLFFVVKAFHRSGPIEIGPTEINAGVLAEDAEFEKVLTVSNDSAQDAIVEELSLSGSGLTLTNGPTLPLSVKAKDTATLRITVRVASAGRFSGKLSIAVRLERTAESRRYKIPVKGRLAQR